MTQRGEEQKDPTLASDILGFVKDKIDSSDLTDISPEILNYVLRERQDQDSDYVTTDASISEDSTGDIIIEGEFLESGEENCSTAENATSYDIRDVKSYSMNSGSSGEVGNSATILFQEVMIEAESRVNFGKRSLRTEDRL